MSGTFRTATASVSTAFRAASRVAAVRPAFDALIPDVAWFQRKLATHGFGFVQSGVLDVQTRTVLSAFQMKYRPRDIAGVPDAETAALLEVLTTPPGTPLPVTSRTGGDT